MAMTKAEKLKLVRNHLSEIRGATLIFDQSLYLDFKETQLLNGGSISKLKDYLDSVKVNVDKLKDILDEWYIVKGD